MTVSAPTQRHYHGLDALRGLAALSVALHHYLGSPMGALAGDNFIGWGWAGVDLFFVLSGFLITGILWDSLPRKNYFRNFYLRRSLRIFPLYYAVFLVLGLLTPILHIQWQPAHALWLVYLGNFYPVVEAISNIQLAHPIGDLSLIVVGHFWTLCIEEQFYFCWPLLIWLVRCRKYLMWIVVAGMMVSLTGRLLMVQRHSYPYRIYSWTPVRMEGLLLGAWLALALRGERAEGRQRLIRRLNFLLPKIGSLCLATLLAMWILRPESVLPVGPATHVAIQGMQTYGYFLVDLTCLSLVYVGLNEAHPLTRFLLNTPLPRLGKVSYGFYIFHMLLYDFQKSWSREPKMAHFQLSAIALQLVGCYCMAKLSFRYFESPFLRLKDKLAPRPGEAAAYPKPDAA